MEFDMQDSVDLLVTKTFAGLVETIHGPAVRHGPHAVPVLLRQGDLDGACGPHCIFMALMMLRVVSRGQVISLGDEWPSERGRQLWRRARRLVFAGADTRDMRLMVRPMREVVSMETTEKAQGGAVRMAVHGLLNGGVAVMGMVNARRGMHHWALLVGIRGWEVEGRLRVRDLLVLNPDAPACALSLWNCSVDVRGTGAYRYRDAAGREFAMRVEGVVALFRRDGQNGIAKQAGGRHEKA